MKFDKAYFDAGIDRRHSGAVKWDSAEMCPDGALPMWIADMDFACAPAIVEAIVKRAQHPCFGYDMDDREGQQAFCDFWKRRHGLDVEIAETVMLPGVVTGLRAAVNVMTEPGDGVAILTPVYGPFFSSIKDAGRKVVECALIEDESGRAVMDYEAIENAFQGGAKMMMLCSPHNPVGRCWDRDELEKLLALCRQYGIPMVSDEIHADFVYAPKRFTPILTLEGACENVISLAAPSKTFNVAGLQHAHAICKDAALREKFENYLHTYGVSSGNTFAVAAARACYESCDEWLNGLLAYLDEGRQMLLEYVRRLLPKAVMKPVEATYLAWVDLRAYGYNTEELNARCKEAGIILNRGTFFGDCGDGFVRINFGCPHANLLEGVKRLAKAVGEKE
ncbi:MAG: putative C-S lyase [Clostridiales bacterium]|nr:putative C-S lyase [Clostridiales bacterium]